TFVRLLRFAGREVDVQNYIDNTGVQVADVVVGFTHIEKKSRAEIEALAHQPRFDYYCWDLYARVSHWYEQDKEHLQARRETLHAIEDASSDTAAIAELISTAVLRRHLETMDRLDIEHDFLRRSESHRPFQRYRRLRRQRHCLSHVEIWPAGARFRLSQVLPLSQSTRLLDFRHRRREKSSSLRRRCRDL